MVLARPDEREACPVHLVIAVVQTGLDQTDHKLWPESVTDCDYLIMKQEMVTTGL